MYRTSWPEQQKEQQKRNLCVLFGHDIKHDWISIDYKPTTTRYELRESLIFVCARCKSVVVDSELDIADKLLVDNIIKEKLKELRQ